MQSCILVDSGESRVLLDCGATSLTALKRLEIDPGSIDVVVLSHLHGDHFGGLPFLILDGQFSRRETNLEVVGPPGTAARLVAAMESLYPGSSTVKRRFEVNVTELVPGDSFESGAFDARALEADHASGAPSLILRLEIGGRVVAYSGDTAWTPNLVAAATGADLFICESYFREKRVPYHLSYAELLEHAAELDCKKIVLTHMTSEMIEATDVEYERAHDELVLKIA